MVKWVGVGVVSLVLVVGRERVTYWGRVRFVWEICRRMIIVLYLYIL